MNRKADFLTKRSIRIHSHNESNRIYSNRELKCFTAYYVEQHLCNGPVSVRLSVRLCVSSVDRCRSVRRICCLARRVQEISIDNRHAGAQQQMRTVSSIQPPQKAKHRLIQNKHSQIIIKFLQYRMHQEMNYTYICTVLHEAYSVKHIRARFIMQ